MICNLLCLVLVSCDTVLLCVQSHSIIISLLPEVLDPTSNMGSLCSKSSNYQGGHTVLGTSNTTTGNAPTSAPDPRTAAAEAAERRMQAVSP